MMQFSSYMKAAGVSEKGEVLQFNDMLSAPQQGELVHTGQGSKNSWHLQVM